MIWIFFALLLNQHESHAAILPATDLITLSKSFSLQIPSVLHAQFSMMPSLGGFWLQGSRDEKSVSIWLQRLKPPALANSFSVNRYWKEGLLQSKANGERSVDMGCTKESKFAFVCRREISAPHEQYAFESFYWNAASDMVVVRVMSKDSPAHAKSVANLIKYQISSRLPASLTKPPMPNKSLKHGL